MSKWDNPIFVENRTNLLASGLVIVGGAFLAGFGAWMAGQPMIVRAFVEYGGAITAGIGSVALCAVDLPPQPRIKSFITRFIARNGNKGLHHGS